MKREHDALKKIVGLHDVPDYVVQRNRLQMIAARSARNP